MHNGQISQFSKIKRRLLAALPEPLFLWPQGHTDSEFAFALFLSHLGNPESMDEFSYLELKDAMLKTIQNLNQWSQEANIQEPSLMNFCVTDGKSIVCTRYVSSKVDEAASLVCGRLLTPVLFDGHVVLRALGGGLPHGQGRPAAEDCGGGERAPHV